MPPTPIITPEQKDIKQKDINCAFVNFSSGFIAYTYNKVRLDKQTYKIIMQKFEKIKPKKEIL